MSITVLVKLSGILICNEPVFLSDFLGSLYSMHFERGFAHSLSMSSRINKKQAHSDSSLISMLHWFITKLSNNKKEELRVKAKAFIYPWWY